MHIVLHYYLFLSEYFGVQNLTSGTCSESQLLHHSHVLLLYLSTSGTGNKMPGSLYSVSAPDSDPGTFQGTPGDFQWE